MLVVLLLVVLYVYQAEDLFFVRERVLHFVWEQRNTVSVPVVNNVNLYIKEKMLVQVPGTCMYIFLNQKEKYYYYFIVVFCFLVVEIEDSHRWIRVLQELYKYPQNKNTCIFLTTTLCSPEADRTPATYTITTSTKFM